MKRTLLNSIGDGIKSGITKAVGTVAFFVTFGVIANVADYIADKTENK